MPNPDPKTVVQRMIAQSMMEGDIAGALGAYAPDFVYHNTALRGMPAPSDQREVMRALLTASRGAFPDMRYTIDALLADGAMVAVLYSWQATQTGSLGEMPATNRPVTSTGAIFCSVKGGQIVEQWDIDDRLDVMQQLGLLPAPVATAG